jgi:hypothetical protein
VHAAWLAAIYAGDREIQELEAQQRLAPVHENSKEQQ